MNTNHWIVIAVVGILGFLLGYSVSSFTLASGGGHVTEIGGYK